MRPETRNVDYLWQVFYSKIMPLSIRTVVYHVPYVKDLLDSIQQEIDSKTTYRLFAEINKVYGC